jgi:hypothetical protein
MKNNLIGITNRMINGDICFKPYHNDLKQILIELNSMSEDVEDIMKRISHISNKYFEYHTEGSNGIGMPPSFDYMIFR